MNKKILSISLLSFFVSSLFIVSSVSAETKAEKKTRKEKEKMEKRLSNATTTQSTLNCIKNAVITRENSIISAFNGYSSKIVDAYQVRLTDLSNAWSETDSIERKSFIKNAWGTFKTSQKNIVKTLQNNKKTIWSTFELARKNCKGGENTIGSSEENQGKKVDE